ncbi:MAG TPA: aminotransferase class III-fold pyridoxal phosphate-dependent enzyme [Chthonomonadaceae bacterium]|nr:aminotransferase class III-fold pyridoxal phosphate-dependent enzyme [Chthonomonadaceae bacterium]
MDRAEAQAGGWSTHPMTTTQTPSQAQETTAPQGYIESIIEKYREYVNPGLARLMEFAGFGDVEESAQGCVVTTAGGAQYLDFVGGFGVFSLGHRHPRVVAAAHRQLDRMPLSTRTFFNAQQALLAEKLASIAPGDLRYTFFSNSGTEAVEAALKIARVATGKTDFISTIGGFHGKSMGSLTATGRESYRKPFEPLIPGYTYVPFDDLEAATAAVNEHTAALIVEPIQGEGGINTPSPGYLPGLRRLCDERGILLIVDEVQTGLGRTGKMFAVEDSDVVPDILTLAKALGGGVIPIGATMATPAIWQKAFGENPLIHTSTFGGNPLACAVGLATIETILEEDLPRRALERGEQLLAGLRSVQSALPGVLRAVRGRGLLVGVEFEVKDVAEIAINGMARRGVIAAYTLNNPKVIRFEPPLVVSAEQVEQAIVAFREAVEEATAMLEGMEE